MPKKVNTIKQPLLRPDLSKDENVLPHVFLLEPDVLLAKSYARALSEVGKVRVFYTAGNAIKAFEQEVPDVVVMELALPAHGGFEFLYEMISYSDTKDVKVIINSSVQEASIPWGIINRGDLQIFKHLYKPQVQVLDLVRAVSEALGA